MLMPKKTKYRKQQKGRIRGRAHRGNKIDFGEIGLQALEGGRITARQIEACRLVLTKFVRKHGKMWIRIFPDKPITKKPAETRMGKGKGAVEYWAAVVRPGKVLFEIEGLEKKVAERALTIAASKLPIKTRVITREEGITYEAV